MSPAPRSWTQISTSTNTMGCTSTVARKRCCDIALDKAEERAQEGLDALQDRATERGEPVDGETVRWWHRWFRGIERDHQRCGRERGGLYDVERR